MKKNFSRAVTYTPEWEGNRDLQVSDQIRATLRPMEFDDLMRVMDAMGGAKTIQAAAVSGNTEALKEGVDMTKFLKEVGEFIPKYVAEFSGLEDEQGPVPIADLVRYPVYMGLAFELLMHISTISMPTEETEKNSEPQPG